MWGGIKEESSSSSSRNRSRPTTPVSVNIPKTRENFKTRELIWAEEGHVRKMKEKLRMKVLMSVGNGIGNPA